mmetsp:Transcript_8669/g.18480  ORF Transcript_8669/g.18480 Transcript_8669/m.18480 type:complete len:351 (-) Transcript_8669:996-2048(-)
MMSLARGALWRCRSFMLLSTRSTQGRHIPASSPLVSDGARNSFVPSDLHSTTFSVAPALTWKSLPHARSFCASSAPNRSAVENNGDAHDHPPHNDATAAAAEYMPRIKKSPAETERELRRERTKELISAGLGPSGKPLRWYEKFALRFLRDTEAIDGRQNPILKLFGFYSRESRGLGAARVAFNGAVIVSESDEVLDQFGIPRDARDAFNVRFEMLALHLWMSFIVFRQQGDLGSVVMQGISDTLSSELQARMVLEEGLTVMQSYKWIKECEHLFYGLALGLDSAVYAGNAGLDTISETNSAKIREYLAQYLTCLEQDPVKIEAALEYVRNTFVRFERVKRSDVLIGNIW